MINTGDSVKMIKANKKLAPMEVNKVYTVTGIEYGVVALHSVDDDKYYHISKEILDEYFEKIEMNKNKKQYDDFEVRYDKVLDTIDNAKIVTIKVFDKCTIVACKLPNGFVVVESSACINPDDYDEDIAIENCLDRIEDKVMTMEAYHHCEELYDKEEFEEDELCECFEECECCSENCEDCECSDECDCVNKNRVFDDSDCDDCDEEDCPFRTKNT